MEVTSVNDLQQLFGPKPINMIAGGQVSAKPFITKRDLIIGGVCLGVGIIAGCVIYHQLKKDY